MLGKHMKSVTVVPTFIVNSTVYSNYAVEQVALLYISQQYGKHKLTKGIPKL
jgi:protein-disulfide isomerase